MTIQISEGPLRIKMEIVSYLGTSRIIWQGNSCRIPIPPEMADKFNLLRGKGKYSAGRNYSPMFLFFNTDKGVLMKIVDKETEDKLKGMFAFIDFDNLNEEEIKAIISL